MKSKWLDITETYDGSQLKSLFAYLEHGLLGDSIVCWEGPCDVSFEHMVDGEDLLAQNKIQAERMLHFIVENFPADLKFLGSFQRLMTAALQNLCIQKMYELDVSLSCLRKGDDLFIDGRKMNVSIATVSPTSGLIHFGVNVDSSGTPVPTFSLSELQWESKELAELFMKAVVDEFLSLQRATQKVRWIK